METKATLLEQIQKYLRSFVRVERYKRDFKPVVKGEFKPFQFDSNAHNSYWVRALKDKYDDKK